MDRFESLCNFKHFNNNDHVGTYQGPSKLFEIYPVLSHLNTKFQILYLPGQNIAIDKSLKLWRGRLSFKQYIPLKSSKFGIKSYELCESSSGNLWSFKIYTGKDTMFQTAFTSGDTTKQQQFCCHLRNHCWKRPAICGWTIFITRQLWLKS